MESLAEFAPRTARIKFDVFCGGVYVAQKHFSRSVRQNGRRRRALRREAQRILLAEKPCKGFSASLCPPSRRADICVLTPGAAVVKWETEKRALAQKEQFHDS